MPDGAFQPLPRVPDHQALELDLLETWERERTFDELRERNRGRAKKGNLAPALGRLRREG